jgi:hypothetical protein
VQAVKRIFRCLKGNFYFGSWYPIVKKFSLIAYTYSEWEGSVDDKKITSDGAFFLGNSLVSWLRKKQASIYLSTVEEKYIATSTCCTQVLG